ncbi:MAG TPA: hypothetical protein VNY51_15345 [Candidatus Dormibacteraeota bacterium]|jgi:hypothetical protein|nr:hypothetical protein [Candidatus Dormibacteraeota bacterium]
MAKRTLETKSDDVRLTLGKCSKCAAQQKVPLTLQLDPAMGRKYLETWFSGHTCNEDASQGAARNVREAEDHYQLYPQKGLHNYIR